VKKQFVAYETSNSRGPVPLGKPYSDLLLAEYGEIMVVWVTGGAWPVVQMPMVNIALRNRHRTQSSRERLGCP